MKYISTVAIALLIMTTAHTQSTAGSGTLDYNGAKYPCDIIEYNLPPDDTEAVIKNQMRLKGFTPGKEKKYLVFRNVKSSDLNGQEAYDLIFNIERKSRKEDNVSVVSLITAKSGELPDGKVKGAGKTLAVLTPSSSAGNLLESFNPAVANQVHSLSVLAKADDITKAEKKLESLKKDQDKLEKKMKGLQSDLDINKKDQESQTSNIETLKKELEVLKSSAPQS